MRGLLLRFVILAGALTLLASCTTSTLERVKSDLTLKSIEIKTTVATRSHSVVGWLKEVSAVPRKGLFDKRP